MTLDHIEKQAQALLTNVQQLRIAIGKGQALDVELLRQMRLIADGLKTATFLLPAHGEFANHFQTVRNK